MGKPIQDENRISINEAAKVLHISPEDFRESLAIGIYPLYVGHCIKKPGHTNRTFVVYRSGVYRLRKEYGFSE